MRRAFTPHSSLDSEIDLNASYLENAIRVTADLRIPRSGIAHIYFAALLIFMRRTTPVEPVEPVEPIEPIEPAEPFSQTIKGRPAHG